MSSFKSYRFNNSHAMGQINRVISSLSFALDIYTVGHQTPNKSAPKPTDRKLAEGARRPPPAVRPQFTLILSFVLLKIQTMC